jgi:hypothetical protein
MEMVSSAIAKVAQAVARFAAKPGECDYFRRHPEAADATRRTISEAKVKP